MFEYLDAVPAYGRKYLTRGEVMDAWNSGLDFRVVNGSYFSKADFNEILSKGYVGIAVHFCNGVMYIEG